MKTVKEILAMRNVIQAEIDRLPPFNIWGDSNEQDIQDSEGHIQDLDRLLEGKETIGPEVESWYDGPDDWYLEDYIG